MCLKERKCILEELELAKASLHNANDIADIKGNPIVDSVLMPLVRSVPIIGDMIDTSMNKVIEDFQKKKEKEFVEVILKDNQLITPEMVNDIEFIVNYAKTVEAIKRLSTNEKVVYFGNLIKKGYLSRIRIENNEFEEYLEILCNLSYREIKYLVFLKEHPIGKGEISSWAKFCQLFHDEFGVANENPYYCYLRLKRTGFVDEEYSLESTSISQDSSGEYELDFTDIDSNGFSTTDSFEQFYRMVLDRTE